MFRHNFLLIYRNFKRFKGTFSINLIGLSTGLACTLLIYLWVIDELRVDKFHEKDNRLFHVMANHHTPENIVTIRNTPGLLAEALTKEIAGIDYAISTSSSNEKFTLTYENTHVKAMGKFASKDFFNAFSYTLIQGDKNQVLADRNSIVISETAAIRLFGKTENSVGKTVEWQIQDYKKQANVVSGVFKDVPSTSSDQFEFLLSFEYFQDEIVTYPFWSNNYAITSLVLKEGTDVAQFNEKIVDFIKTKQADSNIKIFLQQYSDYYLYGRFENGEEAGGRITYVKLFSIIALFILVIACINFMNLSTAKASRRIKEVGIKKAVGANRNTLIKQYLSESMLVSFLSLFVAVVLVQFLLPSFNVITGKHLSFDFNINLILSLLGIAGLTGLVAGSYPALYLSGFNPAIVLKGKLNSSIGELWARKGLVVFQFALSVILIVSVLVVYKQIEFVQNKNLGYDKDNIIYFEQEGKVVQSRETFINEIKKIPAVVNASCASYRIGEGGWTYGVTWEGNSEYNVQFEEMNVGHDAIETLSIQMAEGRSFSKDFASDSTAIIFNETAIKIMGLKDPIGKKVKHYTGEKQIIGVAKDFHFQSLYSAVNPMLILFEPANTSYVLVKIEAGKEAGTIDNIQKFYQAYNPGFSFDYKFMDEDYQNLYAAEKRVEVLSKYFAGLAILISCLGLLGLAAFTAERRIKEIGIRKILGSSEIGIVFLLSGDFTKMIFTSIVIALPISYLLIKYWLDSFAYKIELELWYFISAGMLALFVAWITVGTQTIKAARMNPTNSLRSE